MAKREKTKLTKEEKQRAKAETQVPKRKDAFHLLCGLLALIVSVYTLISLFSYVFTWSEDQSLFHNKEMFSTAVEVENNGGKLGLVWANFLVSRLFGLGAFIVPFFFLGVALYCLNLKKIKLLRFFILSLLGCIFVSLAFSFIFSFTKVDDWFGTGAGGSYGYYVISWLKNMIGGVGTGSIVFALLVIWLILVNGKLISSFYNWVERVTAPKPKQVDQPAADLPVAQDAAPVGNLYADLEVDVPVTCEEASDEDVNPKFEVIGEDFQVEDQVKGDELEFDVDMEGENEFEKEENPAESGEEEILSVEVLSTPDDTPVTQEEAEEEFEMEPFDPRLDLSSYQAPPLTLLEDYKDKWYVVTR